MLCGAPRCTTPVTSGASFTSEYLQLPSSAGCQHAVPTVEELRTAAEYKRRARKKMWCVGVTGLIIACVIVVPLMAGGSSSIGTIS